MKYDVLIVGAGIAGLYTALSLPKNLRILVLSKDKISNCNTYRAQGGIACVWDKNDDFEIHIEDSLKAGNGKNDKKMLELMVKEGPINVQRLIDFGVDFDKDKNGFDLTLEGGHTRRRILHCKDNTGKKVLEVLADNVFDRENIRILEHAMAINIEKNQNGFMTTIINEENNQITVDCRFVVIATGGIGRLYKYTTNASIATGDGIALAKRMGAKLKYMDLIQFHPTGLYEESGDRFLISESVRGEGGILRKHDKQSFMHLYHPMADLAPRDVVSRAMIQEMKNTDVGYLYLDITSKPKTYLESRFPNIYDHCKQKNIFMEKDFVPVAPCQHYFMGGIEIDEFGKTNIEDLYAVGECACSEVHGSNRLASNSLLEALVFSNRAAKSIEKNIILEIQVESLNIYQKLNEPNETKLKMLKAETLKLDNHIINEFKEKIQEIMQNSFFVSLDLEYTRENIQKIHKIREELVASINHDKEFYELSFLAEVSNIILKEKLRNVGISN